MRAVRKSKCGRLPGVRQSVVSRILGSAPDFQAFCNIIRSHQSPWGVPNVVPYVPSWRDYATPLRLRDAGVPGVLQPCYSSALWRSCQGSFDARGKGVVPVCELYPPPPLAQARPRSQKSGQNGGSTPTRRLDKAVHAHDTRDTKACAGLQPYTKHGPDVLRFVQAERAVEVGPVSSSSAAELHRRGPINMT